MGIALTVFNNDLEGVEILALKRLYTAVSPVTVTLSITQILAYLLPLLILAYAVLHFLILPQFSPLNKIPGYPISSFEMFKLARKNDTYKFATEVAAKYGPIVRIKWLGKNVLFVNGAEEIDSILHQYNKSFETSEIQMGIFKRIMKYGLLTTSGQEHDQLKKVLSPAFNINNIRELGSEASEHALQFTEYWIKKLDKDYKEIEVQKEVTRMIMGIVLDCSFGYKINWISEKKDVHSYMYILVKQCMPLSFRNLIPFYKYLPIESNKKVEEAETKTKAIINSIIEERRMNPIAALEKKDLLEKIMEIHDKETGQSFSDEELFGHIFNFLGAGFETTSLGIVWCLLSLAENPEIQNKLRDEIRSICPGNEKIGWEDLENMPYLACVYQESLRKNSPTPYLTRISVKDQVIGGYTIPAGTDMFLWTGVAQNSPQYWDSPEEFRPERFLEKKPVAGSYLPFGSGRNSCIGNKLGSMITKIVLANLLRSFSFDMLPDFKYEAKLRITNGPFPYIKLKVKLID